MVKNIVAVKKAVTASIDSKKLLKQIKPDIVVGTGGYVSGPVLKQAQKLGIKTAIHEQNAYPGVTTKMLAPNADAVMLAMPEAKKHLKLNKEPIAPVTIPKWFSSQYSTTAPRTRVQIFFQLTFSICFISLILFDFYLIDRELPD